MHLQTVERPPILYADNDMRSQKASCAGGPTLWPGNLGNFTQNIATRLFTSHISVKEMTITQISIDYITKLALILDILVIQNHFEEIELFLFI